MTALPLRDLTAAEQTKLAAIEAAPAAAESVTERVAEALLITVLGTDDRDFLTGCDLPADEIARLIVEYGADAAIAVLRGPSSDAEQAVERVLALADEYDEAAVLCERIVEIGEKQYQRDEAADAARDFRNRSGAIRNAVAGD